MHLYHSQTGIQSTSAVQKANNSRIPLIKGIKGRSFQALTRTSETSTPTLSDNIL